jgi:acyl-CoA synthetase (AMP-forming)/AMP-acid ligase II
MRERYNLGDLVDLGAVAAERAAVVDLAGPQPRTLSFGEIDAQIRAAARGLLKLGLRRGDRVALLSANRSEYLVAFMGAMQAGLVAVPVNHRFPREMTDHVLRDCDARLVFCDADHVSACPAELPAVVFGSEGAVGPGRQAFEAFLDPGPFEAVRPAPDETALFLYTSGSTGRPKGVVLSHRSHLWVVETRMAGQDIARHRFLIAAPLYHMNALALALLTLAGGATMVLLPRFTVASYLDAIEHHRCTWLTAVPPMIAMMLSEKALVAKADLSSAEILRIGSAPVSPALLESIHAALPRVKVINSYGTTEGGPVVFGPHPEGKPQPALSLGYPHPGVQLRLVDDAGRLDAEQGVLQVKCPALMTGYHNRPDLEPPFTADGYYITGDVFRRDAEGFHYFVGRTDDMFVCGGENIYPGDVEKLLESHPDIAQACVVPVDDAIKGQKPVAFCVLREGAALTEEAVKRYSLEHAPAYQHPRAVWFLERMPITTTNKVDRKALQARAAAALSASSRRVA